MTPRDLSAAVPLLGDERMVIDEEHGLFVSRLPDAREGYALICHPTRELSHVQLFNGGTHILTIKRVKP